MEDDLVSFVGKCRCCLEDTKGDTYLKITNFIQERFFEFTETNLITSERLSSKICITCNSLLARYSAIRKTFIENQRRLKRLLYKEPTDHESPARSKEEVIQPGGYTVIESIEPFEELSSEVFEQTKPQESNEFQIIQGQSLNPARARNPKTYSCSECSYQVLNHRETLLNHKWKVHGGKQPERKVLVCELCSKMFSKGDLLKRHLAMHSNVKRFSCDHCKFKSHARSDLKNHLLTHLKNDPRVEHKCSIDNCKKVYRNKNSLRNHQQAAHLNQTPFDCDSCSKSFTNRSSLTKHTRCVHEKVRSFACTAEGCSSSFICNAHLLRHRKNIHSL